MYEVGQVLYVLIKKEHSVIPVKVVEKILRKMNKIQPDYNIKDCDELYQNTLR